MTMPNVRSRVDQAAARFLAEHGDLYAYLTEKVVTTETLREMIRQGGPWIVGPAICLKCGNKYNALYPTEPYVIQSQLQRVIMQSEPEFDFECPVCHKQACKFQSYVVFPPAHLKYILRCRELSGET